MKGILFYIKIEKDSRFLRKMASQLSLLRLTLQRNKADISLYFSDNPKWIKDLPEPPPIDRRISILGPWNYRSRDENLLILNFGISELSKGIIDIAKREIRFFIAFCPVDESDFINNFLKFIMSSIALLLAYHSTYFLHSSAVANKKGNAVLFVGSAGSGKTTLLKGLVKQGCRWIENDRVFLKATNNKIWTVPIFRRGGLTIYNQIGKYCDSSYSKHLELIPVSKSQYIQKGVNVKSVIFPSINHSNRTKLTELSKNDALDMLKAFLNPIYLKQGGGVMTRNYQDWVSAFIKSCSFYKLECGKDVKRNSSGVYKILTSSGVV